MRIQARVVPFVLFFLLVATPRSAAAGGAEGSVEYQGKSVVFRHAYLVKGPDAVDPSVVIRELVLSAADVGAEIEACKSMSCVSGALTEGMTVDLDAGPRLNYWVVLKGGMVQYSGTEDPAALTLGTREAGRLAGRLVLDRTASGGPKVDVEFDATLLRTFETAR